jgi:hypothetical protein
LRNSLKKDSIHYNKRVEALVKIMAESGADEATRTYTTNVYYLNKQYNTGTDKLNKWLKANGYTFVVSKVMLSYLHSGKRSFLPFFMLYIYTMYFNRQFNLSLQPYELITFNFELMGMYINPMRKLDKRYNKVKRIV